MTDIRAARFAFLGLCLAYLIAVLLASRNPGPLAWGLHSLGFLKPGVRSAVISLWALSGAVVAWGCVSGRSSDAMRSGASAAASVEGGPSRSGRLWLGGPVGTAIALLALVETFYALRARTQLLGDGTVWLTILKTGQHRGYSEPLAALVWIAFGSIVRSVAPSAGAAAFGLLSILCGALSFLIAVQTAKRLAADPSTRIDAVFLIMTLGTTQLYCGYLESYPPVAVLILAYLWLGLRTLSGTGRFLTVPIALSLATASHLLCFYLWPSYLYLAARREPKWRRRALWCLVPLALTAAMACLAGSRPNDWLESLAIALHAAARLGVETGGLRAILTHALDLANEGLLIFPIALLLGVAGLAARGGREWLRAPEARYLGVAALSGLAAAFALVLPAPAIDWDLFALLFVPAALLSVGLGSRLLNGAPAPFRLGVAGLSLGALLPFLLVNANEDASVRRFQTLIGPGTRISEQGRAYPSSILAQYYEDRGDFRRALIYAEEAYNGEPTNPRYSVKLAAEHFRLGQFTEAARSYEEAIARGWDRAATRHDLGLAYAHSGRRLEALKELRIAVGKEGGLRPDYLHNLGVAYAEAGYPDSARAVWARVLTRWPGYAPTVRSLRNRGW